jgi:hypothetical protein
MLSIPKSPASCERTFSAMHRINTYIRSMLPNRFSKLSKEICQTFLKKKTFKINLPIHRGGLSCKL